MEVFINTNPASPPMVNFMYLGMPTAGALLFPFSDIVDVTKAGAEKIEKNMNVLCKNKTKRVTIRNRANLYWHVCILVYAHY